jgi:hypothetical protein
MWIISTFGQNFVFYIREPGEDWGDCGLTGRILAQNKTPYYLMKN